MSFRLKGLSIMFPLLQSLASLLYHHNMVSSCSYLADNQEYHNCQRAERSTQRSGSGPVLALPDGYAEGCNLPRQLGQRRRSRINVLVKEKNSLYDITTIFWIAKSSYSGYNYSDFSYSRKRFVDSPFFPSLQVSNLGIPPHKNSVNRVKLRVEHTRRNSKILRS